ncbi:glycoside hydrolase family 92 protein [Olivibacter sp. SDN3]|uniref:GH92 family glycosyl hydrolase n=1 Tax=Olivibacter sp. SDN3 TaxID=2764720 RepID=UPI001650ECBA|nr:GH92 family glycosyl hydrolase [Olivibacter sp. SDN3]QNL48007.1 glycoside hydrolase family 92 protein [Olivibacter sp. SDN3]
MKYTLHSLLFVLCFVAISYGRVQQRDMVKYVQTLAGTAASTTLAAQQHSEASSEQYANTIPAVAPPFAMTQWTPQTRKGEEKCVAPYYYTDSLINGFRASHWLSGSCTQDYGSFSVMPVSGSLADALQDAQSPFSHKKESAGAEYYEVMLDKYNLRVAISGTARAGIMQVEALADDSVYFLINSNSDEAQGSLQINDDGSISGKNPVHRIYQGWGEYAGFDGYLHLLAEQRVTVSGAFDSGKISLENQSFGDDSKGVFIGFYLAKGERVSLKMGTSFTDSAGAEKNLAVEIPGWDISAVRQATGQAWEETLGQVQIKASDDKQKRVFYTGLYHAMQHPRLFNDVDGRYPVFATENRLATDTVDYYDDFSMWDIYRAQIPLLEILKPKLVQNLVTSLIMKGESGGWLPIFPCWNSYTAAMIGDHSTSVIASAYLKGIISRDAEKAYGLMYRNAFEVADSADYYDGKGRRALDSYLTYHYIPMEDSVPVAFHKKEQVSRTLEYAYNDYAVAMMAQHLGKVTDYQQLLKRAGNYKRVFDVQVGMVRGRYADGSWYTPFNPDFREPYITEGSPRQYTFYVPQDIPGLAKLMGGPAALERSLDELFDNDNYWHGNEPGHQIPFLYNYTKAPWKTQERVHQILEEEYSDGPGGLSGNDDAGQMSAWYIFAALGLYPVDPVSGNYLLTTPLYESYDIDLADNKKWQVKCNHSPSTHPYIQAIVLNGQRLTRNFITYQEIKHGGVLEIELGKKPSQTWGVDKTDQVKGL